MSARVRPVFLPFRRLAALCGCVVVGLTVLAAGGQAAPPGPCPTPVTSQLVRAHPEVVRAIRNLGSLQPAVRQAATRRLESLGRATVLNVAAALVADSPGETPPSNQVLSLPALALNLLAQWRDPRAASLALAQVDTTDPDMRESAVSVVSTLSDPGAVDFLARALRFWGDRDLAGVRTLLEALSQGSRMQSPVARQAVASFLASPLPPAQPRFKYDTIHATPQDGDRHRLWLYKADGCLFLIRHHPFEEARPGVERCLEYSELREEAAAALAEIGGPTAAPLLRSWLTRDDNTEHRLAIYRALFVLSADTNQDRLDARNLFTATVAPTHAWLQGLGAMVALFQAHADEPALRVVTLWRLTGSAGATRAAALAAMQKAHPEVYARVLHSR